MKRKLLLLLAIPAALCAQTTINGSRTILGSLDASGSTRSLPNRTGTGSPAGRDSCANPGETYFQTDATPGQNLWGCTAAGTPGTWSQISGGSSGESVITGTTTPSGSCSAGSFYLRTDIQELYICSGTNIWELASYASGNTASRPLGCVTGQLYVATDTGDLWYCSVPGSLGTWQSITPLTSVSLNGVAQGAFSSLNLVNAPGLNFNLNPNGQTLAISPVPDTTYLLSQTAAQNGAPFLCAPSSGNSSAYTCNLTPAPSALSNGMLIQFRPDVSCAGGATTMNINGLGAKPIYSLDGASNPAANDCRASRPAWLLYSAALNGGAGAFVLESLANLPPQALISTAERAAPSTPASGLASLWPDSTRHTWSATDNNNANLHIMPRTAGSTDQLASTDLSDTSNLDYLNQSQTFTGNKTFTGTVSAAGASHTTPAVTGLTANKPSSCTVGEMYFATDAAAGQNWFYCTAANTWTAQTAGSGGGAVSSVFGRTGAVTAQSGDYSFSQLSGNIATTQMNSGTGASSSTFWRGDGTWATPAAGNAGITQTTVAYGSSVTFTRTTDIQEFILNLSGNVTSSITSGFTAGDIYYFEICQNSTGGYTVEWPSSGFAQAPTVDPTPNVCTKFHGTWDTNNILQIAGVPTTSESPFLISQAHERSAPSTPSSTFEALWPDQTRLTWTGINSVGNTHIMPRTAGTTDQLASTDLSDTASLAYLAGTQTFSGAKTFSSPITTNITGSTTQCVQASSTGVLSGTGSACGSGSGGANASGYYFVSQSANAPANAVNLGALTSGILKQTVSGGIATPAIATSSDTFPGNAATATALAATPTQCATGQFATGILASGNANCSTPSGGGSSAFSSLTGGMNTSAAMVVGTGASLGASGTGTISATNLASGSSNPGTCTVGQVFVNTASTPALYACTASNTWTQVTGGGGSSTITETVFIPFGSQYSTNNDSASEPTGGGVGRDTGNASGTTPYLTGGSGYAYPGLVFPQTTTQLNYYYATWMLPSNWTGSVNITLLGMSGSATGNAALQVATSCPGTGAIEPPTYNTPSTGTMSLGTSNRLSTLTFSSVSMSGCSSNSPVVIQFGRNAQSGTGDTLSGNMYLLGMQIQWQHT